MTASKDEKLHTLEHAILAMREKIEEQIPIFSNEPLSQEVTVGTGETMLRQNPNVSEFRALIRDYQQAIKAYNELTGDKDEPEVRSLDSIRQKFKVVK